MRTDRSLIPGEEAFRFRHILIRDAAYQAMPKERRADLHEAFADWLGRVGGDRAEEQDEIVGYHLEQAFRYRQELGPLDDRARRLARQASDRLAAAGSRAHTRHDMRAVVNLLGRAEALLDPSDPARLALLPDLSEALWEGGLTEEATALTSEFRTLAEDLGDPELIAYATLSGWWLLGELERPLDLARSRCPRRHPGLRGVRGRARRGSCVAGDRVDRVGPRAGGQAARCAGACPRSRGPRPRLVRDRGSVVQRHVGDRPRSDPRPRGHRSGGGDHRRVPGATAAWRRTWVMPSHTCEPGSARSTPPARRWTATEGSCSTPGS